MRGQDYSRLKWVWTVWLAGVLGAAVVFAAGIIHAQTSPQVVPRITGAASPMGNSPAAAVPKTVTDDRRVMRNYPEQPPVIPHSIDNYQLTLKTNRCLECHRREYTEASGAPMISVTHFMDRDGQILADITPRRYFCTICHVPQMDVRPLVRNTFQDMTSRPPSKQ